MKVTNPGKEKKSKPIKRKQIINEKNKTKQQTNPPQNQQQPKTKNQREI